MFSMAVAIGVYAYLIFFLGLFGQLYQPLLRIVTVIFVIGYIIWQREEVRKLLSLICSANLSLRSCILKNKLYSTLAVLFAFQVLVNLIGALGPELAFDALWYHLTLPKLYLLHHSVYFIPGGLLQYSAMPKLAEMLYVGALAFGSEIYAKLLQLIFGLFTCLIVYRISRNFFSRTIALLAVVIFYSNLVIAWESITAYIDLIRAFFEAMGLWAFLNWFETDQRKWLLISAGMIGLAVTTKLLAVGSLILFSTLLIGAFLFKKPLPIHLRNKEGSKLNLAYRFEKNHQPRAAMGVFRYLLTGILEYWVIGLLIPLPWLIFSYIHTGNPVYPFFTKSYEISVTGLSPMRIVTSYWNLFTSAADPVSPAYLIFLPFVFVYFSKFSQAVKLVVGYSLFGLLIWYITPQTGGGRFIVSYLPGMTIATSSVINELISMKSKIFAFLRVYLIALVLVIAGIAVAYRFMANARYIPVLFGKETRSTFLSQNLNFSFGDFYDTDGYFARHISSNDRILLYGFHNLYYVDFPFIEETSAQKGDKFTAIATQRTNLPPRFHNWQLVYTNSLTMVKLYRSESCKRACYY